MDEHFRTAPFEPNLPVLLGLLTVWYSDFFGAQTQAVLPYDQYLKRFPAYLQQLTMESNGKSRHAGRHAGRLRHRAGATGASPGTNGQHSFYQLIHQGTRLIPADFIGFCALAEPARAITTTCSTANVFAQTEALAFGKTRRPGARPRARPTGWCRTASSRATGPSNTLLLDRLTPAALGTLVALYEHSVFVQGTVWSINSFDQWGVELGKVLAKKVADELLGADGTGSRARQLDQCTDPPLPRGPYSKESSQCSSEWSAWAGWAPTSSGA